MRYTEIISQPLAEQELDESHLKIEVPDLINQLVSEFHEAPYQINNGQCEEFAEQLANLVGPTAEVMWADNLCKRDAHDRLEWDEKLIFLSWPQCRPTHGLTWDDIRYQIPQHAWVIDNDYHYDAECPDGVLNFFQLPLIDRGMQRIAARKAKKGAPPVP